MNSLNPYFSFTASRRASAIALASALICLASIPPAGVHSLTLPFSIKAIMMSVVERTSSISKSSEVVPISAPSFIGLTDSAGARRPAALSHNLTSPNSSLAMEGL